MFLLLHLPRNIHLVVSVMGPWGELSQEREEVRRKQTSPEVIAQYQAWCQVLHLRSLGALVESLCQGGEIHICKQGSSER